MSLIRKSKGGATSYWRFDAVDLRAGIAFASWRTDIFEDPVPAEVTTVHFSPPSFSPEPIANVALALGSTRGSMRTGLLINGKEAWFETLEEVSEFLRRAYVASGGGDGADGSGDSDPSPPLPEPPDLPYRPETGDEFHEASNWHERNEIPASQALFEFAEDLRGQILKLDVGKSCTFSWDEAENSDGLQDLQAGATHVLRELLIRWPGEPGDTDEHLRWLSNFKCWWASMSQLGLRSLLFDENKNSLQSLLRSWAERHEPWMLERQFSRHISYLVAAFLLSGDRRLLDAYDRWIWEYRHLDLHPGLFITTMHAINTMTPLSIENLQSLPLPSWAWNLVGGDLQGRASLYHFLCTLTAQPQLATERRHFELVLFGCACVVSDSQKISTEFSSWELGKGYGPSKVEIRQVRKIASNAIMWFREHLPVRSFSKSYEDVISGARNIRYRT